LSGKILLPFMLRGAAFATEAFGAKSDLLDVISFPNSDQLFVFGISSGYPD
jgi:hypothetical protein